MNLTKEKEILFDITLKAMGLAEQIRKELIEQDVVKKMDHSPVTIADYSCQVLINYLLHQHFPLDLLMGEETSVYLRQDTSLVDKILEHVQSFLSSIQRQELLDILDLGNYKGGQERFWAIDPIDGTKAFVRHEPYAVAISLIDQGLLLVSTLGCPLNLKIQAGLPAEIYLAAKGQGAFCYNVQQKNMHNIHVTKKGPNEELMYCEAHTSTRHHSHELARKTVEKVQPHCHSIHLDSQCKYALVASGQADAYIRFPKQHPTLDEDKENVWDHGPGHLIVEEAGGKVTDILGNPLDYTLGTVLKSNVGIVASNGKIHDALIAESKELYTQIT